MKNLGVKIAWIAGVILSLAGLSKSIADACQTMSSKRNNPQILLAQTLSFCQQLEKGYQQVHAFETQNFYINVCRYKEKYYYHRKSKQNPDNSILLPANSILNGNMFQAFDGKKTYIVGTNAQGYYSSVMYENNEIIFEPELKQSTFLNNRFEKELESFKMNQNKRSERVSLQEIEVPLTSSKCSNNYSYSQLNYNWQQLTAVFN